MTNEQPPNNYFNDLQQLANEQDRAKLVTLAVEFGSILQRLPKIKAEMDTFLVPNQTLDYVGLVQRIEPQLEAAAEFLDEVDFLPSAMRQSEQVQAFIERAEASLVLRTVTGAKQRLQDACNEVHNAERAKQQAKRQAEKEAKRKAEEAAARQREAEEQAERERQAAAKQQAWTGQMGQDQYGRYADLVIEGVQQRFRFIPEGSFMMGSPESEPQRSSNEIQHRVDIKNCFWMADTACTQALWEAVMGNNPAHFTDNADNPVEQVSWNDVQVFLQKVNDYVPDMVMRLPSEAEWEYACRAGITTAFSFGNSISPNQANYNGDYTYEGGGNKGENRGKTLVAKSFSPNAWGLYQMHGNVWEWCDDYWDGYENTPTDGSAARSGDGGRRVLRGGAWYGFPYGLRSAYRNYNSPDNRDYDGGFRFVCVLPLTDR